MRKLQSIAKQLSTKSILNKEEIKTTKGGRRWITSVKAHAEYYLKSLKDGGNTCSMSIHDGKYCIEW